jgi:hypothetical protein
MPLTGSISSCKMMHLSKGNRVVQAGASSFPGPSG